MFYKQLNKWDVKMQMDIASFEMLYSSFETGVSALN